MRIAVASLFTLISQSALLFSLSALASPLTSENIWTMQCRGGLPSQPEIEVTRSKHYFEIRVNGQLSKLWESFGYAKNDSRTTLELKLPPSSENCLFKKGKLGVFECGNAEFVRAQLCDGLHVCLGAKTKVNFDPKLVNIYMSHSLETTLRHKKHHWDLEILMADSRNGGWLPKVKQRLTKTATSFTSGCKEKILR